MNTNNPNHFRGMKKVIMINVLEGNGSEGKPWREVHYFFDLEEHGGTHGGMIGKIDPYNDTNLAGQAEKEINHLAT